MTTTEAAALLGLTRAWLWHLIKRGSIKAERRGRDYWIEDGEVERYQRERKPAHRPRIARLADADPQRHQRRAHEEE